MTGTMPLKQPRTAFTLLEVLLAMTILGGAIAGLLIAQQRHLHQGQRARTRQAAITLAERKMEEARVLPHLVPVQRQGSDQENGPELRWLLDIQLVRWRKVDDLYRIRVQVASVATPQMSPVRLECLVWSGTKPERSD